MTDSNEREEIVRAFIEQWRQDQDDGVERSLEDYLERFPGHGEALAAELLTLKAKARTDTSQDETTIGPYRTVKELGRGGQGVVYLAEDTRFGRSVALKVLNNVGPLGEEVLARFRREALVASRLNHPGICGVLDAEIEGGVPYIAMPFIEGKTLAASIQESKELEVEDFESMFVSLDCDTEFIDPPGDHPEENEPSTSSSSVDRKRVNEVVRLFEASARALHVAHEAGVVHRDLKPANLIVQRDGQPVILDFGLARADDADLETLTESGDLFGTPAYMSPEQVSRGALAIDRRTDIYSLGAALFESLTLHRPFEQPSREALYHAIITKDAPDARSINPRIPRDLATVLAKSLEKDRDRRYASAADFADELQRVRERVPIQARPIGPLTRTARWAQRNPVVASLLTLVILVLSISTVLTTRAASETADALVDRTQALASESAALAEYERLADATRLTRAATRSEDLWPVSPDLISRLLAWQQDFANLLAPQTLTQHQEALARMRVDAAPYTDEDRQADFAVERNEIEDIERELARLTQMMADEENAGIRQTIATDQVNFRKRLTELREIVKGRRTWRLASADAQFRHDILARLVDDLVAFTTADHTATSFSISDRLQRSRRIAAMTTTEPDAARRWREAIERIHANPRYRIGPEEREKLGSEGAPAALFDASGAMTFSPQIGLIPLGPDPVSGLEEFLHVESHEMDWGKEAPPGLPGRRAVTDEDPRGGFIMSPETGVILVLVPAGTFIMGCQNESKDQPNHDPGFQSEGPPHEVALGAFLISKYEMTQAQWIRSAERMGLGEANPSAYPIGAFAGQTILLPSAISGTHPVEQVDWLTSHTVTDRLGLELPTEAQWERAARATHGDAIWSSTSRVEELARFANISGQETPAAAPTWPFQPEHRDAYVTHSPVGTFEPNGFGLHDMTANVWEWCRDSYWDYGDRPLRPGDGLREGRNHDRPTRGGSFADSASFARVANRRSNPSDFKQGTLGLRPSKAIVLP